FDELVNLGCAGWIDPLEEEYAMTSASIEDLEFDRISLESIKVKRNEAEVIEDEGERIKAISTYQAEVDRHKDWPIQYCSLHPIGLFDVTAATLVFTE